MTATVPTMTNGRPQRKQLSEQLDRLDSIIDGLCDGLPQAVAQAAKEGTRAAVKDAILEIMTNPELRAMIQVLAPTPMPAAAPETNPVEDAASKPGLWSRIKARAEAARLAVANRYRAARAAVTGTTRTLSTLMPLRRMVLVAVGTGAVVAALGYVAPAGIAAALAGIGGCVTAAAAQVGNWFRRSTRRLNAT
ncbi:MAG TPA: hypothetical protein VN641_08685 [Urbifossiella sp.]|nr:hypothetical protein [Urbifossiella sp.]